MKYGVFYKIKTLDPVDGVNKDLKMQKMTSYFIMETES